MLIALNRRESFAGLEHAANRTEYKFEVLRFLERYHESPHIWLNFSKPLMYVITKSYGLACAKQARHSAPFLDCVGRLMTTPVGRLAERHRSLMARTAGLGIAPSNATMGSGGGSGGGGGSGTVVSHAEGDPSSGRHSYVGVHIRTFSADMLGGGGGSERELMRRLTPDPHVAVQWYAWEVQTNASDYIAAVKRLCRPGSLPLYIASDSRAAIAVFETLCPGRVMHQYVDEAGGMAFHEHPTHSEALRRETARATAAAAEAAAGATAASSTRPVPAGLNGESASTGSGGGLLLDWLMLSSAHAVVRWGAQHSSFASSAKMRSCGAGLWRSPKSWRYKAATSWLLGKLRFHAKIAAHNHSYNCASRISSMLRTIPPCESGCVHECIEQVYRGFL